MDETHFRADVELRTKWVLRGEPALVDSTSPRLGEVEAMPVNETCTAATSVTFLKQLRAEHEEPLIMMWDNGPAHHGPEIRAYLATPDLNLRLVPLPGYSPDINADEAIWDWIREEAMANTCFGTAAKVREKVDAFFAGLVERTAEVKQRCRRELQAQADALVEAADQFFAQAKHVDFTLESV